jgi:hypothetical protein
LVARQPHNPHSASAEHLDQFVAAKHDFSAGSVQCRLEKATRAASLRRVGRDFGSTLLANSKYRRHLGVASALRSLLRKILPEVTPDKMSKSIKSDPCSCSAYQSRRQNIRIKEKG